MRLCGRVMRRRRLSLLSPARDASGESLEMNMAADFLRTWWRVLLLLGRQAVSAWSSRAAVRAARAEKGAPHVQHHAVQHT